MSLLELARLDHASILADGFSRPCTITNPEGASITINAMAADVGQLIDPETGTVVVGRRIGVAIPLDPLRAASMGEPRGIADGERRPWVVSFADPYGTVQRFKIMQAMPDRVLPHVDCILEPYRTNG